MSFKKLNCPICGKELIRIEPFEDGLYEFWCDDCDIDIYISESDLERRIPMKYSVTIEETLCRTVDVEAESKQDAIDKVKNQYNNENIVLNADDFSEVVFGVSYSTTEKEND